MSACSTYSDQELVLLMKKSDESAFTELYNRYSPQLFVSAYNKLKDDQQAREVVHDVFLNVWKNKNVTDISNIQSYLKRAVRLRIINAVVRTKTPAFFELLDSLIYSPFVADHLVLKKDLVHLLESWIDTFPEKTRRIFIKHYFEELSHLEIANELEISSKTVRNQFSMSLQYCG